MTIRTGANAPASVTRQPSSSSAGLRAELAATGALLTEGMRATGVGPTALAEAVGIPRNHVYQLQRGDRPLYVAHVMRLPEPLREWMMIGLLRRLGKVVGERVPAEAKPVLDLLGELGQVALEGVLLAKELRHSGHLPASAAAALRGIARRAVRIGASLEKVADDVERERVLPLEDTDETGDDAG